jgi:hypothetical protein
MLRQSRLATAAADSKLTDRGKTGIRGGLTAVVANKNGGSQNRTPARIRWLKSDIIHSGTINLRRSLATIEALAAAMPKDSNQQGWRAGIPRDAWQQSQGPCINILAREPHYQVP